MAKRKKIHSRISLYIFILLVISILFTTYYKEIDNFFNNLTNKDSSGYNINDIPEYKGINVIEINNNVPNFKEEDITTKSFEKYSELDSLERCGVAYANIGVDLMPTLKRESIAGVKPTGWHTIKYNHISGKYLYNRCHLIGYQLTGENANVKNLITCTRSMNAVNMVKYENEVADYVKSTNNHVLYRVTPIFLGDNLLATGVQIEALSVEDKGKGIKFNIFIYNVEDKIEIDYKTGESKLKTS